MECIPLRYTVQAYIGGIQVSIPPTSIQYWVNCWDHLSSVLYYDDTIELLRFKGRLNVCQVGKSIWNHRLPFWVSLVERRWPLVAGRF